MVEPATISSAAPSGLATFAEWDVQGEVNGTYIRGVYASLEDTTEKNEDEILWEVATSDRG